MPRERHPHRCRFENPLNCEKCTVRDSHLRTESQTFLLHFFKRVISRFHVAGVYFRSPSISWRLPIRLYTAFLSQEGLRYGKGKRFYRQFIQIPLEGYRMFLCSRKRCTLKKDTDETHGLQRLLTFFTTLRLQRLIENRAMQRVKSDVAPAHWRKKRYRARDTRLYIISFKG